MNIFAIFTSATFTRPSPGSAFRAPASLDPSSSLTNSARMWPGWLPFSLGRSSTLSTTQSGSQTAPPTLSPPPANLESNFENSTPKRHLFILVNGLFGSRYNWEVISDLLREHLPATAHVHISTANQFVATYEGIDVCGRRLAEEIRTITATHPSFTHISVVGHSMGGLVCRYAIAALFDASTKTVAGLKPSHFVTLATPHLGCQVDPGPAQVPLISWSAKVPGGSALTSSVSGTFASYAFGRTGAQLFLLDRDDGGATPPLLSCISRDCPEAGLPFFSALRAFETRTVYANRSGDHLVGWANSSLRRLEELPQIAVAAGTGVVREDPLAWAWAPEERKHVVEESANAGVLDPGHGHVAGAADILEATTADDLVRREAVDSERRNGGTVEREERVEGKEEESLRNGVGGEAATVPEMVEASLESLQRLAWRRVDVCFRGGPLPLLAHQHVQVQRKWVNSSGIAAAKHLALQVAAMEELRLSSRPVCDEIMLLGGARCCGYVPQLRRPAFHSQQWRVACDMNGSAESFKRSEVWDNGGFEVLEVETSDASKTDRDPGLLIDKGKTRRSEDAFNGLVEDLQKHRAGVVAQARAEWEAAGGTAVCGPFVPPPAQWPGQYTPTVGRRAYKAVQRMQDKLRHSKGLPLPPYDKEECRMLAAAAGLDPETCWW